MRTVATLLVVPQTTGASVLKVAWFQIVRNLCSALQARAMTAYGLHIVGWSDLEHTCTRHLGSLNNVAWSQCVGLQQLQQGE